MSAASHHDAAVLRQSFAKYDADGSGSIDVRELRALMHDVTGEEPTDEETAAFSRAVDIDGDGALSFDEFKAIYTKVKSGELAFGGLQLAMDAFDTLVAAEPDGRGQLVERRRPKGPLLAGREDLVEPLLLLSRERLQPLEEQDLSLTAGLHPTGVLQPREHELDQLLGQRPCRADRGALDRGRRGTPRQDLVDAGQ